MPDVNHAARQVHITGSFFIKNVRCRIGATPGSDDLQSDVDLPKLTITDVDRFGRHGPKTRVEDL